MAGGVSGSVTSWIRGLLVALVVSGWAISGAADARSSSLSDWAVIVIAGDWRSHTGTTKAFENARADVSAAFVKAGVNPRNLRQYSLRPERAGDDLALVVRPDFLISGFTDLARQARGGCLFYLTSHGSEQGTVFGPDATLTPNGLDELLTRVCGPRPTVVVVSACYSGIFVDGARRPNRMIITAARKDRSSFGCGEKNRYPYFDACVLESMPQATNFLDLADRAKACVTRMETETGMTPPSEPQVWVGAEANKTLPALSFTHGP